MTEPREKVLRNKNLLGEIFVYLDLPEVCNFRVVCKAWQEIAFQKQLWKVVLKRDFPSLLILDSLKWTAFQELYTILKDKKSRVRPEKKIEALLIGSLGEVSYSNKGQDASIKKTGLFGAFSQFIVGQESMSITVFSLPETAHLAYYTTEKAICVICVNCLEQDWKSSLWRHIQDLDQAGVRKVLVVLNKAPEDKFPFSRLVSEDMKVVAFSVANLGTVAGICKCITELESSVQCKALIKKKKNKLCCLL